MIEREAISGNVQRTIITAMVTNTPFLVAVSRIYEPEFFDEPYSTVAQWCLDYGKQYKEAPCKQVEQLYTQALNDGSLKPEAGVAVASLLDWMSTEWEEGGTLNTQFLLDTAIRYFETENLGLTAESVKFHLEKGDVDSASQALAEHKPVKILSTTAINPLKDTEARTRAFTSAPTPLFKLPGPLGELLNDSLVRDFLLGIQAPEKRGKTYFLLELLFRACMGRCNAAFFEVGDLSESQLLRRFYSRITRLNPKKRELKVQCVDCMLNQKDLCDINDRPQTSGPIRTDGGLLLPESEWGNYTPCDWCYKKGRNFEGVVFSRNQDMKRVLTDKEATAASNALARRMGSKEVRFHVTPTFTTSIQDIDHELTRWFEEDGFVPDIIFIDYADILAPVDGRKEERGQINDTWGYARKLSQDRHALVIMPTQADAASYDQENVNLKNFSNDKRKYAHVNAMLALHMTEEEKQFGLLRTSFLLLREGEWSVNQQVCCVRSLDQGISYAGGWWRPRPEAD